MTAGTAQHTIITPPTIITPDMIITKLDQPATTTTTLFAITQNEFPP